MSLAAEIGIVARGGHLSIRIHDLRHSFICRRLMLWQAGGADIGNAMMALATYVGHINVGDTYWYLQAVPELMATAGDKFEAVRCPDRGGASWLIRSRVRRSRPSCNASSSTISGSIAPLARARSQPIAIRSDCCSRSLKRRLRQGTDPHHPRRPRRGADPRLSRSFIISNGNAATACVAATPRLAAIRSFLKYAAHQDLTALATIERSLSIPQKRCDKAVLGFLSRPEMEAIIAAPDRRSWVGQRDRAMFTMLYNTGARVYRR